MSQFSQCRNSEIELTTVMMLELDAARIIRCPVCRRLLEVHPTTLRRKTGSTAITRQTAFFPRHNVARVVPVREMSRNFTMMGDRRVGRTSFSTGAAFVRH